MAITKPVPAADTQLVTVTIAHGTVVTPERTYRKGENMQVTATEARRFQSLGVVLPDDYVAPGEVQDGQLRMTSADGPTITGVA